LIELRQTAVFSRWLQNLKDNQARKKIAQRLARVEAGLFGDVKPAGDGISELRVGYGPGYRVYFVQRGDVVVILLCGGDKSTQSRDILRAKALAKEV
jgi:putative addiction module killer protein